MKEIRKKTTYNGISRLRLAPLCAGLDCFAHAPGSYGPEGGAGAALCGVIARHGTEEVHLRLQTPHRRRLQTGVATKI